MNAAKCVRKAAVPVLLVRSSQLGAFKAVVAGIDFSETSRLALEEAAVVAGRDAAVLHVLHVHRPPWIWISDYEYDFGARPTEEYQDEYIEALRDQMEAFVKPLRAESPGLKIETEILEDEGIARGIHKYLEKVDCDLVVIGSRGRSRLKEMLLGATAERLIHHSPCSVLTVKPSRS